MTYKRSDRKGMAIISLFVFVLSLVLSFFSPISTLKVSAYQANGWCGAITWSGHGGLMGHYATEYSTEVNYSRGIICLEPSKGALPEDFSYGDPERILTGSDPWIARIGYLANSYAQSSGYSLNESLASWAVATGLAYDVVEGRAPSWGTVLDVSDSIIPLSTYVSIRNWIVERLEGFEVLPSGIYGTASAAEASPLVMTKQADGSFKASLPENAFWNSDLPWYGFKEMEGTSGTITVGGANVSWSRSGGVISFSLSKEQAMNWASGRGYSGAVALTKKLGSGESNYYEVWKSVSDGQQLMMYAPSAVAAPVKGYLAFYAEVQPGTLTVKKTIASNEALTKLCPGMYDLTGTEITIMDSQMQKVAVLTVNGNSTETIELAPGSYYASETKATAGFNRDTRVQSFTIVSGQSTELTFSNVPIFDPMGTILYKKGVYNGLADQPIAGAEFTVRYFPQDLTLSDALARKNQAVRTWVFKTDSQGKIDYAEAWKISGDPLFTTENGTAVALPGTYLYEETKTPENYLPCDPFIHKVGVEMADQIPIQYVTDTVEEIQARGYGLITKEQSGDFLLTELAKDFYLLDGAEYTLYYQGSDRVAKDMTGEDAVLIIRDGKTETLQLAAGTYDVKETKAPLNYELDETVHTLVIKDTHTQAAPSIAAMADVPRFVPLDLMLKKIGKVGGVDDQPIGGAVFKVSYYAETLQSPDDAAEKEAVRTWYFVTDEQGEAVYNEAYFAEGYSSDPLLRRENGAIGGLPGSYLIEEVESPRGYTLAAPLVVEVASTHVDFEAPIVREKPQTIYIRLTKVNMQGESLPPEYGTFKGAEFKVMGYDLVMGDYAEIGKIVTDENGCGSFEVPNPVSDQGPFYTTYFIQETKASPGCLVNENIYPVNPGLTAIFIPEIFHDLSIPEDEISVSIRKVGEDEEGNTIDLIGAELKLINEEDEVIETWISDGEEKIFHGLPAGTYHIEEITPPEGYLSLAEPFIFTVQEQKEWQTFEVINERIPEIATRAWLQNGAQMSSLEDLSGITDQVELKYLTVGEAYTLSAKVVYADEESSDSASGDVKEDPILLEQTITFTAENNAALKEVTWEISEEMKEILTEGKTLVVLEELYQDKRGLEKPVAFHTEKTDQNQQVHITSLKTKAADSLDGDKLLGCIGQQTITDTLEYKGLIAGLTYRIVASLMDSKAGLPLVDKDGTPYVSEKEFIPDEENGEVLIDIPVMGEDLSDYVVVFERIEWDQIIIAEHEDLSDVDQLVFAPTIGTMAVSETTGTHQAIVGEDVWTDTVHYKGLLPETTYQMKTTLVDKESGEPILDEKGKALEVNWEFTTPGAEEGDLTVEGSVTVSMEVLTESLQGKTLVFYEVLLEGENALAAHQDPSDEGQTVTVQRVEIPETEESTPVDDVPETEVISHTADRPRPSSLF